MNILLIFLSFIPILSILYYIYIKDEVEKEPLKLLAIVFIGGVVSIFITKFLATKYQNYIPFLIEENPDLETYKVFLISFGEIGLIEELSKFLILYILIWKNKKFNYIYDGIVYGVFISLGFATIENINYLWYGNFNTLLVRTVFTVPAHASFGIIMGYYFGYAKYFFHMKYQSNAIKHFYSGLFFVILYHGLFDYLLTFDSRYHAVAFIGFSAYLFINAFIKINKTKKLEMTW